MKYTNLLSLFTLLLIVGLSSCKEEPLTEIKPPVIEEIVPVITSTNQLVFNVENNNSGDGLDLDCFSIDFPFGLNVDGTVVEVNTEEEFFVVLEGEPELIDFVYPINVTYEDGEAATANDGEELGELFASCIPDTGWTGNDGFPAFLICDINSCFQLVYPVGLNDGNGSNFTADSEEAFIELIVENPELYFNFPISLTDEDGMTVTAENDQELFNLVASCADNYNPGPDSTDYGSGQIGCYELVFPFNLIDIDGEVLEINDENEFVESLFSGEIVSFEFPITLLNEDGEEVIASDEETLNELLSDCGGPIVVISPLVGHIGGSSLLDGTCYDLVYPFSGFDMNTGDEIVINNDAEAMEQLNNITVLYLLNFPLDLVEISSGSTLTFESADAYNEFLEDCQ